MLIFLLGTNCVLCEVGTEFLYVMKTKISSFQMLCVSHVPLETFIPFTKNSRRVQTAAVLLLQDTHTYIHTYPNSKANPATRASADQHCTRPHTQLHHQQEHNLQQSCTEDNC